MLHLLVLGFQTSSSDPITGRMLTAPTDNPTCAVMEVVFAPLCLGSRTIHHDHVPKATNIGDWGCECNTTIPVGAPAGSKPICVGGSAMGKCIGFEMTLPSIPLDYAITVDPCASPAAYVDANVGIGFKSLFPSGVPDAMTKLINKAVTDASEGLLSFDTTTDTLIADLNLAVGDTPLTVDIPYYIDDSEQFELTGSFGLTVRPATPPPPTSPALN